MKSVTDMIKNNPTGTMQLLGDIFIDQPEMREPGKDTSMSDKFALTREVGT